MRGADAGRRYRFGCRGIGPMLERSLKTKTRRPRSKWLSADQRDPKTETTFLSSVARRKLNIQQLENSLGLPLAAVIKGYATPREA